MPSSTRYYQENQSLRNPINVPTEESGSTAVQSTISPCLGLNPVANRSMESLRILQWCQEIDLPRPATNEGLEAYKEGSRFLSNKEAQIEIPKWSALCVRMKELQQLYKPLQDEQDLTQEESDRRAKIRAEWARLHPEHQDLVKRIGGKRDQFKMFKLYRERSQEFKKKQEAAEFAMLDEQMMTLEPRSTEAAYPPTTDNVGQQKPGTPENWPTMAQGYQGTGSPEDPMA